MWLTVQENVS